MKVYIIEVYHKKAHTIRTSSECYRKFEDAKKFILNRHDNPESTDNPFTYNSKDRIYCITDLQVK